MNLDKICPAGEKISPKHDASSMFLSGPNLQVPAPGENALLFHARLAVLLALVCYAMSHRTIL